VRAPSNGPRKEKQRTLVRGRGSQLKKEKDRQRKPGGHSETLSKKKKVTRETARKLQEPKPKGVHSRLGEGKGGVVRKREKVKGTKNTDASDKAKKGLNTTLGGIERQKQISGLGGGGGGIWFGLG